VFLIEAVRVNPGVTIALLVAAHAESGLETQGPGSGKRKREATMDHITFH